jgi:PAS domain S-box-containing protein
MAIGDLFWRRTLGTTILHGWDAFGTVAATGLIAVSFVLVRAGRYRTGVALYLACTTAVPLTVPFLGAGHYELAMLVSGIIPIIVAAIALSHRWVLGMLATIVAVGMVELLIFPLPPRLATTGFLLLLVVLVSGVLVLVLRRHQDAIGRIRLRTMHANEHAARRSERHYRTLFETVTDGIYIVSRDEKLIEVNRAGCRQLGYTREELLGMPLAQTVAPEALDQLAEIQREVIAKGFVMVEGIQRRKDGSTYPVELTVSMTEVEGAPAFIGVARDITERRSAEADRRRLEDQLQHAVKMESIGRLAGGVAHDFNNLLTAILGNLELANDRLQSNDGVQELLGEARAAAVSAAGLTRQLLAFSRKQIVEPRLVDLNELIARMHRMLVRLIGEDVELRTVPGPGPATVKIDPGLAEQVLVNLAVNARDAMPGGGVLVIETAIVTLDEEYKRSHPLVEPGAYVRLAIGDTGFGMSDEVKQHLFEPFFTTKPRGVGTGLGLATIYGAIRQSNGHVEVYSEVGKGTTFKIYLPAESGAPESLTPTLGSRPVTGGNETILVVEDDERVRNIATQVLRDAGYRVLSASNGEAALAVASNDGEPIHLLLTDVVMPGMNGRQLTEHLARSHPETRTLFTSGYTDSIIAHHGVLERGIEFLSKPYTLEVLTRRVREVLDKAPR